jgi:hypothetical protein
MRSLHHSILFTASWAASNPDFHFHVVTLNGVFSEGDDGSVTFHEATHLTADDILALSARCSATDGRARRHHPMA